MQVRDVYRSPYAPPQVFDAYVERVPDFASSLPAVASVELIDSEDGDELIRVHRWRADVSRFPRMLTALLPAHYFEWTTHCRWDPTQHAGTWVLTIGVFGEGEHIVGAHRFEPDGEGTLTRVTGEVRVRAGEHGSLAGIPIGGRIQGALDRLIQRVFAEIVARSGAIVDGYLSRRAR